jgi:hypothetical protein
MEPNWISVYDRLPEPEEDTVIVYFEKHDCSQIVHVDDYFKDIEAGKDADGKQLYIKWYLSQSITHWMPSPKRPSWANAPKENG